MWWYGYEFLKVRTTLSVPLPGNSAMKSNGSISANSNSILSTKNGQNGNGVDVEQNHTAEARKANPNAVLANEKKAATQLGVIVGMFFKVYKR